MSVFFFTGPLKDDSKKKQAMFDDYRLNQELGRWMLEFKKKYGEDSIFIFDNENWDNNAIIQAIFGGGLFSTKKLIVLKGVPSSADKKNNIPADILDDFVEDFKKKYKVIPEDNLIVFVNGTPDNRSKLFKFLKENASIKMFEQLNNTELKILIKKEFGDINIDEPMINYFINKVGTELYRIYPEIDKLKTYCAAHNIQKIDKDIVDYISFGISENAVFEFMELAFKDKEKAIKHLYGIQSSGTNRNEFAGALYSQLKTSIIISRYIKKGIKDPYKIGPDCGINPKAIFANMKNLDGILKNGIELENMYKYIIAVEIAIKTGNKDESEFRLAIKKSISCFNI